MGVNDAQIDIFDAQKFDPVHQCDALFFSETNEHLTVHLLRT